MFRNVGTGEILLIVAFILIFLGTRNYFDIAKGLGNGVRKFRKADRDIQEEAEKDVKKDDDESAKKN